MIPLRPFTKPIELTDELVAEKTAVFIKDKTKVWGQPWLRKALLDMSSQKCAYCEQILGEGDSYVEVEHFKDKDRYPHLVLVWENLLPGCKRCNGAKSTHDVEAEPILNPRTDIPNRHLTMTLQGLMIRGNSQMGQSTVKVIKLNDYERLIKPKFRIAKEIEEKMNDLLELLQPTNAYPDYAIQKVAHSLEAQLKLAQPDAQYSATVATLILNNPHYQVLRTSLIDAGEWTQTHENLEAVAMANSFPLT